MEVNKYNVSKRLVELRANKGITQKKVADVIGITESSYGKYEQCINLPRMDNLKKLADYFGTTPEYILFGKKEESSTELTRLLEDFTPEEQEKNVKIMKELLRIFTK